MLSNMMNDLILSTNTFIGRLMHLIVQNSKG